MRRGELCGQLKLEYFVERIAGARHRNHGVDFGALLRRAEGDQRPFTVADQHDAAEILRERYSAHAAASPMKSSSVASAILSGSSNLLDPMPRLS